MTSRAVSGPRTYFTSIPFFCKHRRHREIQIRARLSHVRACASFPAPRSDQIRLPLRD